MRASHLILGLFVTLISLSIASGQGGAAAGGGRDVDEILKTIQADAKGSGVVELIGDKLAGWKRPVGEWMQVGQVAKDQANEKALTSKEGKGVLLNGAKGRTSNLFAEGQFGDVAVHIEFMIPKGSNSGIYFMGRYEVQVYDSFGVAVDQYPGIECGGIYPRWIDNHEVGGYSPRVNASLPPGQWQSFDVVFQAPRFDASGKKTANARFIMIVHNGKVIQGNAEVTGPTRAAAFEDEKPAGPLMFQGDHGPVAYRNLRILPLR